jgi:hypothetical protein
LKDREFAALGRKLALAFPELVVQGYLMFRKPLNDVLCGVAFETSGFDKNAFYLWQFFLPLYVPTTYLHFSFGERARAPGGGERWDSTAGDIILQLSLALKQQIIPFISGVETAGGVRDRVKRMKSSESARNKEAAAYSLIRMEDFSRAALELESLEIELAGSQHESDCLIRERAAELVSKLGSDTVGAQNQLDQWEVETVRSLRLEKHWQRA